MKSQASVSALWAARISLEVIESYLSSAASALDAAPDEGGGGGGGGGGGSDAS